MKHFINPKTLEELKKQYRKLALSNHPDRCGDVDVMKSINAEYDELFAILEDVQRMKAGENYTSRRNSAETAEHFKDLINELMRMEDIIIEIIGCFVWVTGNTKEYKEKLKEMNFQWHSKKLAWFLKPEDYCIKNTREYGIDEIRAMYGTSGKMKSTGICKFAKVRKKEKSMS